MNEAILFGLILVIGILFFLLLTRKKNKYQGQPTKNYDDKIDRLAAEQLDNI